MTRCEKYGVPRVCRGTPFFMDSSLFFQYGPRLVGLQEAGLVEPVV